MLLTFTSRYAMTYDYQITGLTTLLLTRLCSLSSAKSCSSEKFSNSLSICKTKLELDTLRLAKCYDMVSFAFYFHDGICPSLEGDRNLTFLSRLQLLLGDYLAASTLHNMAYFTDAGHLNRITQGLAAFCEGESLAEELAGDYSKKPKKLIDYCYLTNGFLLGSSLKSAFTLANLGPESQNLANEFGKNVGIAAKVS